MDARENYYLTGRVWPPDRLPVGRTNDFYLAKYSSAGTLLWERTEGSTPTYATKYLSQQGNAIAVDSAGNIYVAGASSGLAVFGGVTLPATAGGPLLCKYDQDGTLLWVKRVEETGGSASSITLDPDGNIVITGGLSNGPFVAKYNGTGDVQWVRVGYGGGGVAVDTQGNNYFNGGAAGITAMHCGKLTPVGELIWERIIPGAFGNSVALDRNPSLPHLSRGKSYWTSMWSKMREEAPPSPC